VKRGDIEAMTIIQLFAEVAKKNPEVLFTLSYQGAIKLFL